MAPGFWQTLISIAELRKIYCSEIESCKSKPRNSSCSAWQLSIADEEVTTERTHDLQFDKGTIYIVYFHTHVHVHIGGRSGSVVECLTRDRGAAGSSLTSVTALWSLSKTHLS